MHFLPKLDNGGISVYSGINKEVQSFMTTMFPVITGRLQLVSMSVQFLEYMISGDLQEARNYSGFDIPQDCSLSGMNWVGRRLKMIVEDPEEHPWMYRAIIRKSDNLMIGHISFHHKAPDPDLVEYSPFAAELGYTIDPDFRRQGYAKESAEAMIMWAHRGYNLKTFILSISPENIPSLKIAESLHFKKVAERMDEEDGLEYVFRLDKP